MRVVKPKEWLGTPRRQAATKLLVMLPAVLILGVAVQSRPTNIDYYDLEDNPEIDARISNYMGVVRATQTVSNTDPNGDPRSRVVAKLWLDEAEAGKLKPLPQQRAEDVIQSGVKSQILMSANVLSDQLYRLAGREEKEGEFDQAARDLTMAALVPQSFKYSDVASVALVSGIQRRMLKRLHGLWRRTSLALRQELSGKLECIESDAKMLDGVLKADRHYTFIEAARRRNIEDMQRSRGLAIEESYRPNSSVFDKIARRAEAEQQELVHQLSANL